MSLAFRPQTVAGLRLVRLVGSGGEGEVWEARTPAGERRAVKLVRPEAVAAPEQVALRGDWLRRIDHSALVRVRRTGMLAEHGLVGWGLVEMDFVDGRDLSDARADAGALRRLRPLAAALDDLHDGVWSNGTPLVHRDVKPSNLIAVPDGRVVLVDCSSLCGVDRSLLTRIGTPLFAAPEVVTGRIGPAADVYSFAATVVALATGARGDRLAALLEDPWATDLPDPVRLALAADPARRPHRCSVLLDPEVVRLTQTGAPVERGPADRLLAGHGADGLHDWGPVLAGGVHEPWLPAESGAAGADADAVPPVPAPGSARAPGAYGPSAGGWQADGVLDAWPSAAEHTPAVPAPPPRAAWPFLALLGGVGVLLTGAVLDPGRLGMSWTVTAVALSVIAHLGAGRRVLPAIVVPTVSWAFLLADRASADERRRAWVRNTVSGALTGAAVLGASTLQQVGTVAGENLLIAVVAGGFALTAATVATARAGRRGSLSARILLAPLTCLGALLFLFAAVISLPVTLLRGRPAASGWLAHQAARGMAAVAAPGPGAEPMSAELADAAWRAPDPTIDDWTVS